MSDLNVVCPLQRIYQRCRIHQGKYVSWTAQDNE